MPKYDISILLPARNEMFLRRTVEDILEHIEANTEIIVGLDGQWASPGVPDDPRVTVVYYPKSIGQRAMTNQLCRLSQAKYVIKTDAHCSFAQGFDKVLMESMRGHDDWTIVPEMRNLHAFDWVCNQCKDRRYQGPTPTSCLKCSNTTDFTREMIWIGKESPKSHAYTFDTTLHFQYFRQFDKRKEGQGDIVESMSLQGSFFMLTRQKYWELNICDEKTGSWGQQGVEVACKTWLSGGKVICNKNTWYAHMFRTQGGDFGFPYKLLQSHVEKARNYSRDIWFNNKFEKQIRPLSWLIERFKPLTDWHDPSGAEVLERVLTAGQQFESEKGTKKGIIYFTDNQLKVKVAHAVQKQLKSIGIPIVSASLKPMDFGKNIYVPLKRGIETMFKQIIIALENSDADIVYFCEHDVLYHPSHFNFIPQEKNKFYYNQNWWKVWSDGFVAHWDANQVSGLCGYREHILSYYRNRLKEIQEGGFNRSYEPGGRDSKSYIVWQSEFPNIDIRHDNNLTRSHRSQDDARSKSSVANWRETTIPEIQGWDTAKIEGILKA